MITYTLCNFRVKSEDYLNKLHEFYKACRRLGMVPQNYASVIRGSAASHVTIIEITKRYIYPRSNGRIQIGDTIQLLVGQLHAEEVKL